MEKKIKSFFLLVISLLTIFALSSCKMRAEQKSLTGFFSSVDEMIEAGLFSQAMFELKKAEKRSVDEWSLLAIYKRYIRLGEKERAEKLIKDGLKKNSKSPELLAVYSEFLISNNRLDEAYKYAVHLKNTDYGSLFSEVELRMLKEQKSPEELNQIFRDKKYYNVYYDAYKGSGDPVWLRNCALFNLRDGLIDKAAALYPSQLNDPDDAFFWGLVLYDAGRFYDAVNALESSRRLLSIHGSLNGKLLHASEIQQVALESDAYIAISDMEKAEETRQLVIDKLNSLDNLSAADMDILASVTLNSAIYAGNTGNDNECADLLLYIVDKWPDLPQGLILFADFAFKSNQEREEDFEIKELRKAGLATMEMEEYDSRRKLPISDALYRINNSLSAKKNPYLEIAKLDLKYKLDKSFSVKEKTADLWRMLEENYTEEVKYENLLVQYALSFLLKTKQYEDANMLFHKHMNSTYKFNQKEDFWDQVENMSSVFDVKMLEFAALIAMNNKKYSLAFDLYEKAVYQSGGSLADGVVSPYVSTGTCMNLGDIYFSVGQKENAIDLYGKAAGRESSAYLRSEIFYRIACIYNNYGDIKNTIRSLDYALAIYPDNARASLLKTKLNK